MSTKKVSFKEMKEAVTRLLASQRGVSVDDRSTITMVDNMTEENLEMFYDRFCGVNEETGREIIERVKAVAAQAKEAREAGRRGGQGKKGGSEQKSDLEYAMEVIDGWGKPLVYNGAFFYEYSVAQGWVRCDKKVEFEAMRLKRTTQNNLVSCARVLLDLSRHNGGNNPAAYYKYGGADKSWTPTTLGDNQVLFCNGLLTMRAKNSTELSIPVRGNGRFMFEGFNENNLIFGPMITFPFSSDMLEEKDDAFTQRIEKALPEEELKDYLQKVCGLILQPHVLARYQIVFRGVPRSGKSTLATAIACAPAGLEGFVSMSEKTITKDQYASTALVNKFACVSHDSAQTSSWEHWFKEYSSGTFTVRRMRAEPITMATTAKMITTCNELQETRDQSGAMAQRYRLFDFNNPIPSNNTPGEAMMQTEAYWTDPARRIMVLSWLLRGVYLGLTENVIMPESMEAHIEEAISEQDVVRNFIKNNVVKADNKEGILQFSDLRETVYLRFKERISDQAIARFMEMYHDAETERKMIDGKRLRGYYGYAIK